MRYFDLVKELTIEINTFDYTIEEVLIQKDLKERQRSLRYISKIMNLVKQNYMIFEKKILTMI